MKFRFSYLVLILALTVASCAGYFSVFGLSQLFAGAGLAVIVMASVLEVSKVAVTTALHRYWYKLTLSLKIYMTTAVIILMIITSAGIYGFLSNAYQKTSNKLEIHEGAVSVISSKKDIFLKAVEDNKLIINTKSKRIEQLSDLRSKQENRMDVAENLRTKDKIREDIKLASNEIQKLSSEIDEINKKNSVVNDSINKYSAQILDLNSKSEVAGEVGPLKYISNLTKTPMDKVVNYLILLLIFVFDPLAIALVLLTNRIFEIEEKEKSHSNIVEPEPIKEDKIKIEESIVEESEPVEEVIEETEFIEEPIIETENILEEKPIEKHLSERSPVIPTGKISLEDIREIKDRGYSVNVPQPKKNNAIERIGSNKVIKDGDNNKVFFKRD